MARHSNAGRGRGRGNGEGSSARTSRYRRRRYMRIGEEMSVEQREEESDTSVPAVTIEDDLRAPIISPAFEPSDSNGIDVMCSDTDVLDCNICYEPLSPPIFQCINGHIVCGTCCSKIDKCAMCSMPIGQYRCRAMEKLLESVKTTCGNKSYGCGEVVRYSKKYEHEKTCFFAPCLCPHTGCNFRANSRVLAFHFISNHQLQQPPFNYGELFVTSLRHNENVVVLQALTDSKLFVIKNQVKRSGNILELCHIGPNKPNPEFSFEILARNLQGNDTLILQSEVKTIQEPTPTSSSSFLFVPFEFFQPSGRLVLVVRITTFGALQLEDTIVL